MSARSVAREPPVPHGQSLATKKECARPSPPVDDAGATNFATLVQTHTGECVLVDARSPERARFDELLADRVTGSRIATDPRLLDLLRTCASRHPTARIEIVSGFRSPKLNEMLRKKGHHVASHSQHSLGHAVDFRLVPPDSDKALDPRDVERELRELSWEGGIGVYPSKHDWFVHADVGPKRRWRGD